MANKQTELIYIPITRPYIALMGTNYNHTHYHKQISNEDKLPAIALIIIVPLILWIIFKQQDNAK
jgi:hypothetical protein